MVKSKATLIPMNSNNFLRSLSSGIIQYIPDPSSSFDIHAASYPGIFAFQGKLTAEQAGLSYGDIDYGFLVALEIDLKGLEVLNESDSVKITSPIGAYRIKIVHCASEQDKKELLSLLGSFSDTPKIDKIKVTPTLFPDKTIKISKPAPQQDNFIKKHAHQFLMQDSFAGLGAELVHLLNEDKKFDTVIIPIINSLLLTPLLNSSNISSILAETLGSSSSHINIEKIMLENLVEKLSQLSSKDGFDPVTLLKSCTEEASQKAKDEKERKFLENWTQRCQDILSFVETPKDLSDNRLNISKGIILFLMNRNILDIQELFLAGKQEIGPKVACVALCLAAIYNGYSSLPKESKAKTENFFNVTSRLAEILGYNSRNKKPLSMTSKNLLEQDFSWRTQFILEKGFEFTRENGKDHILYRLHALSSSAPGYQLTLDQDKHRLFLEREISHTGEKIKILIKRVDHGTADIISFSSAALPYEKKKMKKEDLEKLLLENAQGKGFSIFKEDGKDYLGPIFFQLPDTLDRDEFISHIDAVERATERLFSMKEK